MVTTRSAVLTAERTIEIREFEVPEDIDEGCVLEVESSGMCGSDWSLYTGENDPDYPLIPGHEVVGRVHDIDDRTAEQWGVSTGDRVAVGTTVSCGHCDRCVEGDPHLCSERFNYGFTSTRRGDGLWGGFSEYMTLHPNTAVHRLPEDLSTVESVMFNPLGNCIGWIARSGARLGDSVLIMGPGQRGLGCTIACREAGMGDVFVSGLSSDRKKLALAETFGASETIDVETEDLVDTVHSMTDGKGVDLVIDTTPNAIQPVVDAVEVVRRGGTIALTGHKSMKDAPITIDELILNEITMRGMIVERPWADRQAIRVIGSGKYPLEEMHTHTFALGDAEQAFEVLGGEDEGAIHISVRP